MNSIGIAHANASCAGPSTKWNTDARRGLPVILGYDQKDGNTIQIDLYDGAHLLAVGTSGSGKTCLVLEILCQLAQQDPRLVRWMLVDGKQGVDFGAFDGLPHLLVEIVTTPSRVVPVLQAANEEIDRRWSLLKQLGRRSVAECAVGEAELPLVFVVIEELSELLFLQPEAESLIVRLCQRGRAAGVVICGVMQRNCAKTLAGLLRANFSTVACFRTANRASSQVALDAPGAERLARPGEFLLRAPNFSELKRGVVQRTTPSELSVIISDARRRFKKAAGRSLVVRDPPSLAAPEGAPPRRAKSTAVRRQAHRVLVSTGQVAGRLASLGGLVLVALAAGLEFLLSKAIRYFRKRSRRMLRMSGVRRR